MTESYRFVGLVRFDPEGCRDGSGKPSMSGRNVKLREVLLGFEGLALLRGLVHGDDADMDARIEQIRDIAEHLDDQPYASGMEIPELNARTGYAYWAATYDVGTNPLLLAEQPVVEAIVAWLPSGRALDAACGTGRHSSHLSANHSVTGIDGSPEMLARARAAVPGARFALGDLTRLPLPDNSYDLVVCALALCHVVDLVTAIRELARVSRPGARVILTDPHPMSVVFLNQAFFSTEDGGMGFVRNHYHAVSKYLDALPQAGLRLLRCHEPAWKPEYTGGLVEQFAPGAMSHAVTGLPFAIVWELEKE